MLHLQTETKLDIEQALNKSHDFLVKEKSLNLVEVRAHMHVNGKAAEIGVLSKELKNDEPPTWRQIIAQTKDVMESAFDFHIEHYILHLHAGTRADIGHLMVQINHGAPVTVEQESVELDAIAKSLAAEIS